MTKYSSLNETAKALNEWFGLLYDWLMTPEKKALFLTTLKQHPEWVHETVYEGQKPLMIAARYGHTDLIEDLIRAGSRIDEQDDKGFTALMLAVNQGHGTFVEKLVNEGASLNLFNKHNKTALILAASIGERSLVRFLIDQGADVNMRKELSRSALFEATIWGCSEVVQELLDAGAECHEVDDYGFTPLMAAVDYGSIDIVKSLLEAGADLFFKNADGGTAMDLALKGVERQGDLSMVNLLGHYQALEESRCLDDVLQTPPCSAKEQTFIGRL